MIKQLDFAPVFTRRQALAKMGTGFGMVGLAGLVSQPLVRAAVAASGPLDVKPTQFLAKAKHVIFLFMNGGVSQVDTFDPKPMLDQYDGKPMPGGGLKTAAETGNLMRSPFTFRKYGQSGIEVTEIFPHVGEVIDDFCVIRSVYTDVPQHEQGLFMMNCGHTQRGRPSICASEFGRTPVNQVSADIQFHGGRDHNHHGFTVLMAGGGVKGGMAFGATDEFGFKAVENPVHVHDLHATILHQLGLDHEKLTYRYSGRDFRLTDVEGRVVQEILV